MELAHRWGNRNLTRLELVVAILILATMIGFFSKYALTIFSRAEQSLVNRTLININTALYYRSNMAVLKGEYEALYNLMKINPMDDMQQLPEVSDYKLANAETPFVMAGGMVNTPANYGGVIYSDDEILEKGKWYFNQKDLYLEYVIRNSELFTSEIEGLPRIRFRTVMIYNDENENGHYEPDIDKFQTVRLNSIDKYQWSR
jgi:hypothetical protein